MQINFPVAHKDFLVGFIGKNISFSLKNNLKIAEKTYKSKQVRIEILKRTRFSFIQKLVANKKKLVLINLQEGHQDFL